MQGGLLVLFAVALIGAVAAFTSQGPAGRFERISVALVNAMAACVAVTAGMTAWLGLGDGRALVGCGVAPLLVVALRGEERPMWAGLLSGPLVGISLLVQGLVLAGVSPDWLPDVVGLACAAAALGSVGVAIRTGRFAASASARAQKASEALTCALATLAALLTVSPDHKTEGLWGIALAAAVASASAARLSRPPLARDLVGVALLAGLAAVAAPTTGGITQALVLFLQTAFLGLAASAGARALAAETPPSARRRGPAPVVDEPPLLAAALAGMSPILDDGRLRQSARPRVVARFPARRVLDAALERARISQNLAQNTASLSAGRRTDLRLDVSSGEGDLDVEGDPVELAEALHAVLDHALQKRAIEPDLHIGVLVRGGPQSVTFEVRDDLPDDANKPAPAPVRPLEAALPSDLALARARLLVEKHGGKLVTRIQADGSFVLLTLPRRVQRGPVGLA